MDTMTSAYYASHAAECAARYDAADVLPLHELLQSLAPAASRVLEIGGGSGRGAAFPLPDDHELLLERYDMVLCAAVIMHLDDASLERLAMQLVRMVADTGRLVLSHSRGHRCPARNRDSCGRLFIERTPTSVNSVLRNGGFRPVELIENPDGLGRDGITWATHVLQKTS